MKFNQKYTLEQQKRINELRAMSPEQWESLCKNCGICCLNKIAVGNMATMFMDFCCEHLDCSTHRCKIYPQRLKTRNQCKKVNIKLVLDGELLPASCAYHEYIFGPAAVHARVNWAKITPISDSLFDRLPDVEIVRHFLIDSLKWNARLK